MTDVIDDLAQRVKLREQTALAEYRQEVKESNRDNNVARVVSSDVAAAANSVASK